MNNTINPCSNINFNSRYLRINNPEKLPIQIYNSIYKSEGIYKFLSAGQPKTFWQHIKDLFRKNEFLTVDYTRDCSPVKRFQSGDIFSRVDEISFTFGKEGTFYADRKRYPMMAEQSGTLNKEGQYDAPAETIEDILSKQIENIGDLETLLK